MTAIESAGLELQSVSVAARAVPLVHAVSIMAEPGSFLGIIGPNGAGKSSLLRTVYRATRPASGRILLDGTDIWRKPARWCAQRIGAVLQDMPAEFPLTARDVLAMGRAPHQFAHAAESVHDRALIEAAIGLLDLGALVARRFSSLSGGERQRVLLARALVQQPRLLVLDEPTNHLDLHHQMAFLELVGSIGLTVIAALHDLTLAAMFCDRLVMLDRGRVVAAGTPEQVLTAARLRAVYGVDTVIRQHPVRGTVVVLPT